MSNRAQDWWKEARNDLDTAKDLLQEEHYNWACFASHQASEKAVKALLEKHGALAWGHSVRNLLQALPSSAVCESELLEFAKELDQFYIPTRYPNAHVSGAPYEFYTKSQAERAVDYAEQILRFCQRFLV